MILSPMMMTWFCCDNKRIFFLFYKFNYCYENKIVNIYCVYINEYLFNKIMDKKNLLRLVVCWLGDSYICFVFLGTVVYALSLAKWMNKTISLYRYGHKIKIKKKLERRNKKIFVNLHLFEYYVLHNYSMRWWWGSGKRFWEPFDQNK